MPLPLPDAAESLLAEARQVHLAVPSKGGPHVTPELYAWAGGRLWFASASSTLKTKVLRRTPAAGAVVSGAGRSVVLRGPIQRFDVLEPIGLARNLVSLPRAARALAGYTVRNAPDLLAFVRDSAGGRLGDRIPPRRVLFCLDPSAAALVENDELVGCWGAWSCEGAQAATPPPAGGEPAVAALPGLVALPGRWFGEHQRFQAPARLFELADAGDRFDMSVVVDRYNAPGPAAKEGILVRGRGTRLAADLVEIDDDVVIVWDGVETVSST